MEYLQYGSQGPAVSQLQQYLADYGYNPGSVDGIFGYGTQQAVMAFQQAMRLTVDGIFGPNTRAAIPITQWNNYGC